MSWLNYAQIHADLRSLIEAQVAGFNAVLSNADERDIHFNNMPLCDVRLILCRPEIRTGRDYYVFTSFEIEIVAHSLQSQGAAASVRDSLLASTLDAIRDNSAFSAFIQTSRVGDIGFAFASDEKTGAFVAAATFEVITESYVDRS